jgi:hypothetical protein
MKNLIAIGVLLIGAISLLSISYKNAYPNPILRERLNVIEPFQTKPNPEGDLSPVEDISPAPTSLENPRQPYNLLNGVLPAFKGKAPSPTSKRCYDEDFQTRIERTGNFRQLTNNYKRGTPDSCSSPNHDLLLSFYKVEPLPV